MAHVLSMNVINQLSDPELEELLEYAARRREIINGLNALMEQNPKLFAQLYCKGEIVVQKDGSLNVSQDVLDAIK